MSETNLERARFNMIEQQIRPWEVLDERVLGLLDEVPREDFVSPEYRNLAYMDISIPIGKDQVMMPPRVEARLLQALNPQPGDKVLEVGTGSGYLTALLARMADHVYSVEIEPELSQSAAERLAAHGIKNVTLEVGDAARGWSEHEPYDAIILTGSVPLLDENFQYDLAINGRLVAIVGQSPAMQARLITRQGPTGWSEEVLFETDLPALRNAPEPEKFQF